MSNISILLVEDDISLMKQLREYLEIFFDTVYVTNNGKEGLACYEKYRPDVIMSDINMPLLSGLKMIKKIRENDSDTQIIILSAYTTTEYFLEAVKLNLVSYLVKPIESNKLKDVIIEVQSKIIKKSYINLKDGFKWDIEKNIFYKNGDIINLTNYEILLIQTLLKYKNQTVTYETLHYYIYNENKFSQNAITSLIKRVRKKIPKELIKSVYKEGYKIEV